MREKTHFHAIWLQFIFCQKYLFVKTEQFPIYMLHSKICQNFISSTFICLYNWIHFHSFMFMMIDLKFHWRCSLIENHNQNIIHLSNRQKLRNPIEIFIEAWITHSQRSSFVGVIIQWWHCKRIWFLIYQYFFNESKGFDSTKIHKNISIH